MKSLMKRLYSQNTLNPFKKYVYSNLRKVYTPPRKIWPLLTFDEPFDVTVGDRSFHIHHTGNWIENELFWSGLSGYEPVSVDIWQKACQISNVILDIGANTGLFTLLAKTVNPHTQVYAFEPLPQFHQQLQKNLDVNHYNVSVEPIALSNYQGTANFYVPELNQGNLYSSSLNLSHYYQHQSSQPRVHSVEVTTLDQWLVNRSISNVDLVKIDAEGEDLNILKGFSKTLQTTYPDFLLEIQNNLTGQAIQSILTPDRYLYFSIDEAEGLKQLDSLQHHHQRNVWICKPETATKLNLY
jgi:FkbM family methyltransferase